jgi:hypothetical protein
LTDYSLPSNPCDDEEIAAIGFGETTVAFRYVGGDPEGGSVDLV